MPKFLELIQSLAENSIKSKVTQLEPRRVRRQKAREATAKANTPRKV